MDAIRVVLALLDDHQRSMVEASLKHDKASRQSWSEYPIFDITSVEGRGIQILASAANADVVVFGLEDEALPGEASHVVATYPEVKVIGVDEQGLVRIALGAVSEPLSHDLPTALCWITRRSGSAGCLDQETSRDRPA